MHKADEKLTVLFISAFFQTHPLASPSLSERGGKRYPAMSYPLSIIERGTRGKLRKIKKTCQLWTFSPGFYRDNPMNINSPLSLVPLPLRGNDKTVSPGGSGVVY
jgi:hypothetical protein